MLLEKQRNKQKKRSTAVLQPFVNLKSNTMKNTMQRYLLFRNMQRCSILKSVNMTLY